MHTDKAFLYGTAEPYGHAQSDFPATFLKPVRATGHAQTTKGTLLDHLALVNKKASIPKLHGTVITGKTVPGRPLTSRPCKDPD